jgi:acetate kinase
MLVLVANLGSTSFKFKLLDMSKNGEEVARGGYERIGQPGSPYPNHGAVIDVILKELAHKPDAIGFKAVHGGPISGAVRVTDEVIAIQQQFADIAPAHNPPYIAAMKAFAEKLPGTPQVAGVRDRRSTRRSRSPARRTRCRSSGSRSTASAGTGFTARAIATSRRAWRSLSGRTSPAA